MDTRTKKVLEDAQDQALQKVGDEHYLIQPNKIYVDNAYKEAVIYNLVHKLDTLDAMNKKYAEALEKVETYPSWLKYYVHVPYLLHGIAVSMFYMKHKQKLTLNRFCAVVCGATVLNEIVKSIKIKRVAGEITKEYDQYAHNYHVLLSIYSRNVSLSDIFKYLLGISLQNELVPWKKYYYRDDINNQFQQSIYYE